MYIQLTISFFINSLILVNAENPTVATANGLVFGTTGSTVDSGKEYYAFRGIPYAEPPLGNLRFKAPVPKSNWNGTLNATTDRNICVQPLGSGSEDCLFINVYTTKLDPTGNLPVMVYIYGGLFLEGDSTYKLYGPDYLLEEDVVVVTFNYRLGVFGFLSTGDMAAPGNWGIKDQAMALEWVQINIKNFGGDPNKVTLFGQSAGSASVSYLIQAPLKRKLFRGAIMQSGTSLSTWSLANKPKVTAVRLGRHLGIFTNNSTVLVNRLRQVNVHQLYVTSLLLDLAETALTNPKDGLIFAPCEEPDHDGAIILGKSHEKLNNGNFSQVPLIVGFVSQEGNSFGETLAKLRLYLVTYDLSPTRLVPDDMNVRQQNLTTVAIKIRNHYFGTSLVTLSDAEFIELVTDDQFVRPAVEAVRLMSKYTTVYFYRFSYVGPLGLQTGASARKVPGPGHTEDLRYIWREQDNIKNPPPDDILTRRRLVKLWTNFAKTLNPTPEKDSLFQNVTWELATPQAQTYLDIGKDFIIATNLSQYSIDWWRGIYNQYGCPPFNTY